MSDEKRTVLQQPSIFIDVPPRSTTTTAQPTKSKILPTTNSNRPQFALPPSSKQPDLIVEEDELLNDESDTVLTTEQPTSLVIIKSPARRVNTNVKSPVRHSTLKSPQVEVSISLSSSNRSLPTQASKKSVDSVPKSVLSPMKKSSSTSLVTPVTQSSSSSTKPSPASSSTKPGPKSVSKKSSEGLSPYYAKSKQNAQVWESKSTQEIIDRLNSISFRFNGKSSPSSTESRLLIALLRKRKEYSVVAEFVERNGNNPTYSQSQLIKQGVVSVDVPVSSNAVQSSSSNQVMSVNVPSASRVSNVDQVMAVDVPTSSKVNNTERVASVTVPITSSVLHKPSDTPPSVICSSRSVSPIQPIIPLIDLSEDSPKLQPPHNLKRAFEAHFSSSDSDVQVEEEVVNEKSGSTQENTADSVRLAVLPDPQPTGPKPSIRNVPKPPVKKRKSAHSTSTTHGQVPSLLPSAQSQARLAMQVHPSMQQQVHPSMHQQLAMHQVRPTIPQHYGVYQPPAHLVSPHVNAYVPPNKHSVVHSQPQWQSQHMDPPLAQLMHPQHQPQKPAARNRNQAMLWKYVEESKFAMEHRFEEFAKHVCVHLDLITFMCETHINTMRSELDSVRHSAHPVPNPAFPYHTMADAILRKALKQFKYDVFSTLTGTVNLEPDANGAGTSSVPGLSGANTSNLTANMSVATALGPQVSANAQVMNVNGSNVSANGPEVSVSEPIFTGNSSVLNANGPQVTDVPILTANGMDVTMNGQSFLDPAAAGVHNQTNGGQLINEMDITSPAASHTIAPQPVIPPTTITKPLLYQPSPVLSSSMDIDMYIDYSGMEPVLNQQPDTACDPLNTQVDNNSCSNLDVLSLPALASSPIPKSTDISPVTPSVQSTGLSPSYYKSPSSSFLLSQSNDKLMQVLDEPAKSKDLSFGFGASFVKEGSSTTSDSVAHADK